ncbi:MAG: hypothetical protein JWM68_4754, partial [Verrucomicrobiales bacterium]|nr:hypothetical protein [Verrucomicrobiales bacterium]
TYRCPTHEPSSFGVNEPMPKGYWGQLLHPFRPKSVSPLITNDLIATSNQGDNLTSKSPMIAKECLPDLETTKTRC